MLIERDTRLGIFHPVIDWSIERIDSGNACGLLTNLSMVWLNLYLLGSVMFTMFVLEDIVRVCCLKRC
jgi:hypothetical protein